MIINFLINLSSFKMMYITFSFCLSFMIFFLKYQTFMEMLCYMNMQIMWFEQFTIKNCQDVLNAMVENSFNLNLFIYTFPLFYTFLTSGWNLSQRNDWYFLLFFIIFYYFFIINYFNSIFSTLLYNIFNLEMVKMTNMSLDFNILTLMYNVWSVILLTFWLLIINLLITFKLLYSFLYLTLFLMNLMTFNIFASFLMNENMIYLLMFKKLIFALKFKY